MPGGGDFCFVFRPGGRSFALKSCPEDGDFDGKISGPGLSPGGGMVTGQIDTCITGRGWFRLPGFDRFPKTQAFRVNGAPPQELPSREDNFSDHGSYSQHKIQFTAL